MLNALSPHQCALMPTNSHQQFWLGLHLIPNFGIAKLSRLLTNFDSAEELWRESDASVKRLDLPETLLAQFCAARAKIDLAREMDRVANAGASLITLEDETYPRLLRSLPDRPVLLYCRGLQTPGGMRAPWRSSARARPAATARTSPFNCRVS